LPSADATTELISRYADRAADLAVRLGAPDGQALQLVEDSALALIDQVAADPERVHDAVGTWLRDLRARADRARADAEPPAEGAPPPRRRRRTRTEPATSVDAVENALRSLDEEQALALLLRDSYDLPWSAVAVGLGLDEPQAAIVVADARQRFDEQLHRRPSVPLAHHAAVAGVSAGALAQIADSDADSLTGDSPIALRARHAARCAVCGAFLEVQRGSRRALAALPVRALPDGEHDQLLSRVTEFAGARLPAEPAPGGSVRGGPPGLVTAITLVGALAVGVTIGTVTAGGGNQDVAPATTQPATTASAAATNGPASGSPTPSGTPSTSLSAGPSTSRSPTPRPSLTVTPTRTAVVVPPTSAAASTSSPAAAAPAITLSPTGGRRGTAIRVTGVGFHPGAVVTVTYRDNLGLGSSSVTATVSGQGTFAATVSASGTFDGSHVVAANDGQGATASSTFAQG
jgi:DNA-directed RNA polymerase specialized sigma24 family protein